MIRSVPPDMKASLLDPLALTPVGRFARGVYFRMVERLRTESALIAGERRTFSQGGEDGILEGIFALIGAGSRTFAELGCGDGRENNTRALALAGWSGVWVEAEPALAGSARADAPPGVTVVCERLTRENVRATLARAGIARAPDLLSIDVDGNDYHLWEGLADLAPRVVVIEYNASLTPRVEWVMAYDPEHRWDGSNRFGASLRSLAQLGGRLGYALVACDSQGVNAFFVARDLAGAFEHPGDVARHYRAPKYAGWFGHPSARV